jgi:hypothetical protein
MTKMKATPLTALLLAVVFLTPLCASATGSPKPLNAPMLTITSRAGGFTVQMPGQPVYKSERVETRIGTLTLHTFSVGTEGGRCSFAVMYNDYPRPPANVNDFFNAVKDGTVANGRLLREAALSLSGYPGRGMVIEKDGTIFIVNMYLVGARLYQLIFAMPKGGRMPYQVEQFFDSFALIGR